MSTLYSDISRFKLNASFISCCFIIDFQAKTDTITQWNIITNKVVSAFESLSTNTPLGGLRADDMGLGKTIQAIALIGTSKERMIANPHCSTPPLLNYQLEIRNIQACSGWSAACQNLPWSHLSLII
ncbi:hypothetical protein O181_073433 [Austropuccinia psidii MF-1]|uniref:SNF2 N-terminal domain-containing protein n=1 Tax=Austropuccinia psidii MF-1 TaxID=1389203 RepID=A0A9Q3F500_9BASI|nr:hypothetical protein [Austropuccinia psidii MF-1]